MSPLALCTDSSAQLPAALVATLGLDVVPMSIAVDDLAVDEPDLDVDAFYAAIDVGGRATTLSRVLAGSRRRMRRPMLGATAKSSRSTSAVRSREPWDRPRSPPVRLPCR